MNAILVVNAGSSSLKFALYDEDALGLIARGEVAGFPGKAQLRIHRADGMERLQSLDHTTTVLEAAEAVLAWLGQEVPGAHVTAAGHRIVHGGDRFAAPMVLHEEALEELAEFVPQAPLHQAVNLAMARLLGERLPDALAVGCFDTAFHRGWPDWARRLPLPRHWHDVGVRRYGFHGLSYEYLSERVRALAPRARRVVLAHLGSGASVCAVLEGRSIDATMGFSTLDGLPMATRAGSLDPGVIVYLHRVHGMSLDAVEAMLYHDCGLHGVSGATGDMRQLLLSASPEAREAVDLFTYRCAGAIGAMAVALNGIDTLVFSGGIGANSPAVRAAICARLRSLSVRVASGPNGLNAERIAASNSRVRVYAIQTDEEIVIARACRRLLLSRRAA